MFLKIEMLISFYKSFTYNFANVEVWFVINIIWAILLKFRQFYRYRVDRFSKDL